MKPKILVAWGTRPEAIKLAPVVLALRAEPRVRVRTCVTAQHREMLDQMNRVFRIRPDHDLDLMRPDQSLEQVSARALEGVGRVIRSEAPDLLLVQGDTTTAFASALAAFYERVPVAHVEAGLRSGDTAHPFPEEMNRVLTADLASLHFSPTPGAARNLRAEGVPAARIHVTGNTVVDALRSLRARPAPPPKEVRRFLAGGGRTALVTCHRRESFGAPFESVCSALLDLAGRFPDLRVLYSVHPNPNVQRTARRRLGRHPRFHLSAPIDYARFLPLLEAADLILTDSGGIQEEAPAFNTPVVVLRGVTERPEAVRAGAAVLAGTDRGRIVRAASRILSDPKVYRRMASVPNPFGDGRAAERIRRAVLHRFGLGPRPADWSPGA